MRKHLLLLPLALIGLIGLTKDCNAQWNSTGDWIGGNHPLSDAARRDLSGAEPSAGTITISNLGIFNGSYTADDIYASGGEYGWANGIPFVTFAIRIPTGNEDYTREHKLIEFAFPEGQTPKITRMMVFDISDPADINAPILHKAAFDSLGNSFGVPIGDGINIDMSNLNVNFSGGSFGYGIPNNQEIPERIKNASKILSHNLSYTNGTWSTD
jgi:hypothetical protein